MMLNTIRYADDNVIICDSMEAFQQLISKNIVKGTEMGPNINIRMTSS